MKLETPARCFRQSLWLTTTLLGLLVIFVTGCVSQPELAPEGSAAMKQQALSFNPPPGRAGLYIIRPYHFYNDSYYGGSAILFNISLDYQGFGALETNSYLFALVPPGNHTLNSGDFEGLNLSSLATHFTVEAGTNYYFTATRVGSSRVRHFQLAPISETDGQALVRKLKLSGDNRFDLQNQPGPTR